MEDLRIVLIIIGALAIGALLIHGLWSIRKQNQAKLPERPMRGLSGNDGAEQDELSHDTDGFDRDGIGKVRVVSGGSTPSSDVPQGEKLEPVITVDIGNEPDSTRKEPVIQPAMQQTDLFAADEPVITATEEEAPKQKKPSPRKERKAKSAETAAPAAPQEEASPELVLVLNVQAHANESLSGAAMLPALLTLGFKYGEMSIFHRHEDSAGTGEVLFSMVNMVKPGTFDPESMETFTTPGVSLFLALPGKGEAQKTFSMMLNAAEQLAEELGGQITDEQRNVLTKQKIRHYQERIREFERKRLVTN